VARITKRRDIAMKKGTFSLKRIISVTLILCAVLSLISSSVLADGAYVLETGNITLTGTGAELASSDAVKKAYLGG